MLEFSHQEIIDPKFREGINEKVYDLCLAIGLEGFTLTLVGGAVRDYLLTGRLSRDLDFELRHKFEYDEKEWSFRLNRLSERLSSVYNYEIEFLSFHIMRISVGDWSFEIAPARRDIYQEQESENGSLGHSDFLAELISNLDYEKSFARRDFTINALGIEFGAARADDEFKFIDPFGGMQDIANKVLRPCSKDFFYDPVRFLRLIRFSQKFDLKVENEEQLVNFNLKKLTLYYFFREAFKGHFLPFVKTFYQLAQKYDITLSPELNQLKFLEEEQKENLRLKDKEQVLMWLCYRKNQAEIDQTEIFTELALCKQGLIKEHLFFRDILQRLEKFDREKLKTKFRQTTVEEFLEFEDLTLIKSFHRYIVRHDREQLAKIGAINPHLYATFLKIEEFIPKELQGKEHFEGLMKNYEHAPKKRGELLYYAHFLEVWG
jgi:tRNA nucleotidyltransferase/poly(A) polymerase